MNRRCELNVIPDTASLAANLIRLVGSRIQRSLTPAETATVLTALDEGLSVLQTGGTSARQQLLANNLLTALSSQGGAWLWASTLEAIERPAPSLAALASGIVESCSTTAAMLFADAAMAFATDVSAGESGPCIVARRTALGGSRRSSRLSEPRTRPGGVFGASPASSAMLPEP